MDTKKPKKSALYYLLAIIMGLSFIFLCWPNILGWNRNDVWVIGMPISQFCIYLFPLLIMLALGGMYLLDYHEVKNQLLAKRGQAGKGGDK